MKEDLEYEQFANFIFREYIKRKQQGDLYQRNIHLFKNIIGFYFSKDRQPYFKEIIDEYKELYIFDESRVEDNLSLETQLGLGEVYDYIRDFDFEKDKFNIFLCSLLIHEKLYSKSKGSYFGGKLRNTNAMLADIDVEVVDYQDAIREFNTYISQEKCNQLFEHLKKNELFEYINECVILTTKLIKLQPFADGNKRTFRALLNLLFKRVNIPPVFIEPSEREEYKKDLITAITTDNYDDLIKFYYYKICDAIILLDLDNLNKKDEVMRK